MLGLLLGSLVPGSRASSTTVARLADASSQGCGTWKIVPSVIGNIRLSSVVAVSPNDVWAAGQTGEGGLSAVVEHWDGTSWSRVPEAPMDNWQGINGLAALAPDDVWAVGWAAVHPKDLDPFLPLVEHWNGNVWRTVPAPAPPGARSSVLVSVTQLGSQELLAVGYAIVNGERQTLAERWDGSAWSIVPSANPGSAVNGLLDVIALRRSSSFAVGYQSDGRGYRSLVERWNGTGWTVANSSNPANVDDVLTAVAATPTGERWAVGYGIDSRWGNDTYRTLAELRQTDTWKAVSSANAAGTISLLDGAAFSSATDGWAVGARFSPSLGGYRALIEHWDGSGWTLATPGPGPDVDQRLRDVATVPGTQQAWAVGNVGINGMIEHSVRWERPRSRLR
jgi:hypothetical protein